MNNTIANSSASFLNNDGGSPSSSSGNNNNYNNDNNSSNEKQINRYNIDNYNKNKTKINKFKNIITIWLETRKPSRIVIQALKWICKAVQSQYGRDIFTTELNQFRSKKVNVGIGFDALGINNTYYLSYILIYLLYTLVFNSMLIVKFVITNFSSSS
jgi:hypothetical protein